MADTAERVQLPFQVVPGMLCDRFPYTCIRYEADVDVPNGGTRRLPQEVKPGPLAMAILEMMRIYEDQLQQIHTMQKEYNRDQKTIAALQGEIEKLENQLRGHESRPKKPTNGR